jgi:hypothetical protein
MPTWLFALVVLGVGLGMAFFVDRMMARPGSGPAEPRPRSERSKWLYYWFMGRFPEKDEGEEGKKGKRDGPS